MQSAKSLNHYRFHQYDVSLTILNDQKVSLIVCDSLAKMEFGDKEITLKEIKSSTLMRALEQNNIEVKIDINTRKNSETSWLEIQILVSSQFVKPVEEAIFLPKRRDISESEIIRNAADQLAQKLKSVQKQDKGPNCICNIPNPEEKLFNSANNIFEELASIRLSRGKYIVFFSFFAKPTNTLIYLYLNNGQQIFIQNNRFYSPANGHFLPFNFRKVYQANNDQETLTFQAYCTQSYPCTFRNVTICAKKID